MVNAHLQYETWKLEFVYYHDMHTEMCLLLQ